MKILCYLIFFVFFPMTLAIFGGQNSQELFVCLCTRVDIDIVSGDLNGEDYIGVVTVLSEKWVITASDRIIASNVPPNVASPYLEVVCNVNEYVSSMYDLDIDSILVDIRSIMENIQARRVIRYEYLQPYGLVLLELDENLNGNVVNLIQLPPSSSYESFGTRTIIGWEDQDYLFFTGKIKTKAEVQIELLDTCMDRIENGIGQIPQTNIRLQQSSSRTISCVNRPSPPITTCNVDSGSPIVDFGFNPPILVGITMWNNRMCNQDATVVPVTTAVNINEDTILTWINQITDL